MIAAFPEIIPPSLMGHFAGTPLDPAFPFDGTTRSAAADLVRLERVSKERLNLAHPARRFEELPGLLPSVRPGEVVWLEVSLPPA